MGASAAALARPLAVTMGDPAGIGLEIALKAWSQRERRGVPGFVLYADPGAVTERARSLGLDISLVDVSDPVADLDCFGVALPIVPVPLAVHPVAGHPTAANAHAVIASIERATRAVVAGRAAALVTNPIAKSVLYEAGFSYPGHTEYLAGLAGILTGTPSLPPVMMLAAHDLRVVPLTIHVPLKDVPALISRELLIQTIDIVVAALRRDFGVSAPRIAVAGLNPHAGENGSIGTEDRDTIAPAIAAMAERGFDVTGPYPADTMFHAAARSRYDVAIAMYHDQALIPIKTLAFDAGVNVTLGLPFVRTSPDHGTAFDIAAGGTASPESLIAALHLASRMVTARARTQHGIRP